MAFTYFFRDWQTIDYAINHVVPATSGMSKINVWDAGCASGQEPYTLAIGFAEKMGKYSFRNLNIFATDIDGSNLFKEIIEKGEYAYEDLQRIPADIFAKYFIPAEQSGRHVVIEEVRRRITFQKHDLLSLVPPCRNCSLVVCKNVLLHFAPEERCEVIKMFQSVMLPGGYLIMEQTQQMPQACQGFFQRVAENAQLYRKL